MFQSVADTQSSKWIDLTVTDTKSIAIPLPIHFLPVCLDASACNGLRVTITDSLLAGPSRCFSSQRFAPHCRWFTSRQFVATLQLAIVHASPSSVCRDASAHNGSCLTVVNLLLAGPSRHFNSQRFAPHRHQFASRRSIAMLQLATISFTLSTMILVTLQSFAPLATLRLPPSQWLFISHPTSDSLPSGIFFFFSFWVNFFVNFCLMILVPLGIFV